MMDNLFDQNSRQDLMNLLSNSSIPMPNDSECTKEVDEEVPMTFPQKLMEILSNEEISDTVAWLPHGKGFIIYKKKKFAAEVLPKYFKQSKFTSFTRKLNRWGFTRVTRGPETGAYYHKYFRQGDLRLCMQMSCQSTKVSVGGFNGVMPSLFGGGGGPGMVGGASDVDLAQQNQSMIRHQLQQLQLQQLQLQQLQMQQQQQLQAAELMRQALAKQNLEDNGEHSTNYNNTNNNSNNCFMSMDPSTMFLHTLQRTKESGNGLLGSGPIALLPTNTAGMGEPTRHPAGNGRAWAA